MQPIKLEDRPPFVQFETRSVEDREASITAGHYVGNDVDFAVITPAGSKDRIERICSEWFPQLREQVVQERMNPAWLAAYEGAYKAYKDGKEPPVDGTPVLDWPGLSPSQVKQLVSLGLRAVEDVAAMNEETIANIGMGGRALKDRAISYLAAARDIGAVAESSAALKVENAELKRRSDALELQVKQLAAQMAVLAQVPAHTSAVAPSTAASISLDDLGLGDKL